MGRLGRIAWFYDDLNQNGGAQRLSLEGCRRFEELGIESPYLLYPERDPGALFDGKYRPRLLSRGRDARAREGEASLRGSRAARGLVGLAGTLSDVLWLRKTLRALAPDLVLTEGTGSPVIHVYLATLGTGIPYAVQIAGSIFALSGEGERSKYALVFRRKFREIRDSVYGYRETAPERPPRLGLVKRLFAEARAALKVLAVRKASRLFVHTRQNRWEVQRLYGRDSVALKGAFPESIFKHRADSDVRERLGLSGRKVIYTLSRFASHKRVDLCLRAFAKLRARLPGCVILVGGKSYSQDGFRVAEDGLRRLAAELGIEEDVRFLGYVPERDLWDTYLACDAFVHMDRANFDLAPYEALALGRKVVWSREMEIDEGLDGGGRIFPALPTPEDTARALFEALSAPAPPMTDSFREALRRYTWEEYFGSMLAVLESAP